MSKKRKYKSIILMSLLVFTIGSCDLNSSKNTLNNSTIIYNKDASLKLTNYDFESTSKEVKFSIDGQEKILLKTDSTKTVSFENLTSGKEINLSIKTIFEDGTERVTNLPVSLEAKKINSFKVNLLPTVNDVKLFLEDLDSKIRVVPSDELVFDTNNLLIANTGVNRDGDVNNPLKTSIKNKQYFWFEAIENKEYIIDLASINGDVDLYANTDKIELSNEKTSKTSDNLEVKTSDKNGYHLFSGCYTNPIEKDKKDYNNKKESCKSDPKYDNVMFNSYKKQKIYILVKNSNLDQSKYNIKIRENDITSQINNNTQNNINEKIFDLEIDTQKTKSGNIDFSGWTFSDYGVSKVEVYIDGILHKKALVDKDITITRTDTKRNVGFNIKIDSNLYNKGTHKIIVKSFDKNNRVKEKSSDFIFGNTKTVYLFINGIRTGLNDPEYVANLKNDIKNKELIYSNLEKELETLNENSFKINPNSAISSFRIDRNTYNYKKDFELRLDYLKSTIQDLKKKVELTNNELKKINPTELLGDYILSQDEIKLLSDKKLLSIENKDFFANIKIIKDFLEDPSNNFGEFDLKGVYNPTGWGDLSALQDLFEAGSQKCGFDTDNSSKVVAALKQAILEEINLGNKVIILSHSQGNMHLNRLLSEIKSTKDIGKSLGVLGLGSPDRTFEAEIPEKYYISNAFDLVSWIGGIDKDKITNYFKNIDIKESHTFYLPVVDIPFKDISIPINGYISINKIPLIKIESKCSSKDQMENIMYSFENLLNTYTILGCYDIRKNISEKNEIIFSNQSNIFKDINTPTSRCYDRNEKTLDLALKLDINNGLTVYHPLDSGYLSNNMKETKNAIIEKLKLIKNNLLKN